MPRWVGAITNTTATTYNATDSDCVIIADTTSNSITLNLPTAVGNGGRSFMIKKTALANTVTITPFGSEKIDNGVSLLITSLYGSYSLISDGANWWIV